MYDYNDYQQHQEKYGKALHKIETCVTERINLYEIVRIAVARLSLSQLAGVHRLVTGIISYKEQQSRTNGHSNRLEVQP